MFKFFLLLNVFILLPMFPLFGQYLPPAEAAASAAKSINSIGLDLLHTTARPDANALLSPYSIEIALAMTYAGADGQTRDEMARVLHLPKDDAEVAKAFGTLQQMMDQLVQKSAQASAQMKQYGESNDPITLDIANRLFGQKNYDFRAPFLDLLKTNYHAPFQPMDFAADPAAAAKVINGWVEQQTKQRIRDLIPPGALNRLTELVLVNAVYLKAPWAEPFQATGTKPMPFYAPGGATEVPMMSIQKSFGYAKTNGVTVVSLPYSGRELQFLIILPDDTNGLGKVEGALTAEKLAGWANLPAREVRLFLPKFKMEPPTLPLGDALQKLGMKTAFDIPKRSANFDRMAPRRPDNYLYISDVFHKTFLSVDEKGTEAAAATAVAVVRAMGLMRTEEPVEVKVDHPFILAIQHRSTGACLFLGHVVNPK
jgi:serpin B